MISEQASHDFTLTKANEINGISPDKREQLSLENGLKGASP